MKLINFIEFKKRRDLGAIITDAFGFIRENWKDFFGTIIKIAGPVLIVLIVAIGLYMKSIGEMVQGFDDESGAFNGSGLDFTMVIYLLLMIGSIVVFYVLMQMASLYYIKSYIENKGVVNKQEINENIKQYFWKFIGFGILMGLMVGVGMVLCLLPGIYLAVVLSLGTAILVFEGKSVGDTINHCFELIKGYWWETFAVVFVIGLLVGILGQIFGVPAMIYQFVKMGVFSTEIDPTQIGNIISDPVYLILIVFSYFGQFLMTAITIITSVFIYYDLNEKKNGTGSLERIQNLGNQ